jgi:hypothetical protein
LIGWEGNGVFYTQWVLVSAPGHPFLQRTMEIILDNLHENRFPFNVHEMTGPAPYTQAIQQCLSADASIPHRLIDLEHGDYFRFRYPFAKPSLYGLGRRDHWRTDQHLRPVLSLQEHGVAA